LTSTPDCLRVAVLSSFSDPCLHISLLVALNEFVLLPSPYMNTSPTLLYFVRPSSHPRPRLPVLRSDILPRPFARLLPYSGHSPTRLGRPPRVEGGLFSFAVSLPSTLYGRNPPPPPPQPTPPQTKPTPTQYIPPQTPPPPLRISALVRIRPRTLLSSSLRLS